MEQVIQELFLQVKTIRFKLLEEKMGYIQRKLIDGWRIVVMNFGVIYHKD